MGNRHNLPGPGRAGVSATNVRGLVLIGVLLLAAAAMGPIRGRQRDCTAWAQDPAALATVDLRTRLKTPIRIPAQQATTREILEWVSDQAGIAVVADIQSSLLDQPLTTGPGARDAGSLLDLVATHTETQLAICGEIVVLRSPEAAHPRYVEEARTRAQPVDEWRVELAEAMADLADWFSPSCAQRLKEGELVFVEEIPANVREGAVRRFAALADDFNLAEPALAAPEEWGFVFRFDPMLSLHAQGEDSALLLPSYGTADSYFLTAPGNDLRTVSILDAVSELE